ncbi:AraC family transcriptional regulator [Gammaproteobacteria bacterium]|nr:AraC family transcriptional regulator [Gammaproteobacteria bacterium]
MLAQNSVKFEQVQNIPDYSFHFQHYQEPVGDPMPLHIHPEFEFDYVIRGQGYRMIGDEMRSFSNEEVAFLPPNLPHCLVHENQNPNKARDFSENLVLQCPKQFIENILSSIPEINKACQAILNIRQGVIFRNQKARMIKDILKRMDKASAPLRIAIFIEILPLFLDNKDMHFIGEEAVYSNTIHKDKKRIEKAYRYIIDNYQNKITLHDVAQVAAMSDTAFSAFFSKTVRKPFSTFLIEYRIERACKLIKESKLNISDISYAVGFSDIPYFNRTFKKVMNQSPSEYKKQHK